MPQDGRAIGATTSVRRGVAGACNPTLDASARVPIPAQIIWAGSDLLGTDWLQVDRVGDTGNNEAQGYSPAQNSIVTVPTIGDCLQIQSKKAASHGKSYVSGMIQWANYSFKYGSIKAVAKFCGGTGPWPAIWFLGTACQATNPNTADNGDGCDWPNPGSEEIDVWEVLGSDRTHINPVTHVAAGQGGLGNVDVGVDMSTDFHTLEMIRSPTSIVWKFDGSTVSTLTSRLPTSDMFCIINVAVGGVGGGTIVDATLPVVMQVRSITVTPA